MSFRDRGDAGRRLAGALQHLKAEHPVVLALPRGGVPVAAEVSKALDAPLDLLIVRKLGAPTQPELAMGAVADAEPPIVVRNEPIIQMLGISERAFQQVLTRETAEARRRRDRYLGKRARVALENRTVIVVDDGIATGSTMQAALRALQQSRPRRVVLAIPVAATDSIEMLRADADEVICLEPQPNLGSIGAYYSEFVQVGDEDVIRSLDAQAQPGFPAPVRTMPR